MIARTTEQLIQGRLDEAIQSVESRRYRRILLAVRLPLLYTLGILVAAFQVLPVLLSPSSGGLMRAVRGGLAGWEGNAGELILPVASLAAGLAAFLRAGYLWSEERRLNGFEAWLMTRQEPGRVVWTVSLMATAFGLLIAYPAILLGTLLLAFGDGPYLGLSLALLLIAGCAAAGGVLGSASFFAGQKLVDRRATIGAAVLLVGICLLAVLRVESVENGWRRNWEEHPGRIVRALGLLTPIAPTHGMLRPDWWAEVPARSLGTDAPAWAFSLWYAALLGAVTLGVGRVAGSAYRRLAADPDCLTIGPAQRGEEAGTELYWQGFRNPIWTRDVRTRLRSKETGEFIFFASVATACGAFIPLLVPLVTGARDLADPLETASAAREVFFWLSMTLLALLALIAPGLTAESIANERLSGTLALLISTPLRPSDIIWGRLLGAASVLLLLVSPSLPLFGLCYLFHGASGLQVIQVLCVLLAVILASAFFGLAFSATMPRAGMARFWGYSLTAIFVGIPGGALAILAGVAAPDAGMRSEMTKFSGWTLLVTALFLYGIAVLWGSAREQLEYLDT